MTFSTALELIKWGLYVSREAWDNSEFYLFMDDGVQSDLDIYIHRDDDLCSIPYTPNTVDILANDWYIVD